MIGQELHELSKELLTACCLLQKLIMASPVHSLLAGIDMPKIPARVDSTLGRQHSATLKRSMSRPPTRDNLARLPMTQDDQVLDWLSDVNVGHENKRTMVSRTNSYRSYGTHVTYDNAFATPLYHEKLLAGGK